HGMKAGIMVAAAKSYFHTLVHETDLLTMLRRMSSGLKNLNMKLMYMGLILMQCRNYELEIAVAGMPPILHYSKRTQNVTRVTLKGLPLGGKAVFPYKAEKMKVEEGDVLLLMSDGLPELFNAEREMFGIERVEEILMNSNGYGARDIITQIKQGAESWVGSNSPHDDITLMVLKVQKCAT
ncbi:MAG: PP2C family protein-serine/threonine phosphatase, partial [Balneolaceae bacterium]|nr:PP2C family protein-serine/threonine phosphatase [Balneolaceae bacterium]